MDGQKGRIQLKRKKRMVARERGKKERTKKSLEDRRK